MDSNPLLNNAKKYYNKYYTKYFYYMKILFIIIVILLLIYLVEKYIIYNLIYFILYLITEIILPLFFIKNVNIFSIKIESILIAIYLHIILARVIVLSIIFLQGGLLKKLITYEQFKCFINNLIIFSENAIESINKNINQDVKYFMSKLNLFKLSYNKIKSKNMSFVVKDYNFEEELNEMIQKYDDYIKNKLETTKEFAELINHFSNKINKYTSFSIFEQLFTFKYTESLMVMEEYMMNSFETHIVEKINIEKNFDIYILSPKKGKNNKILSIYCNQNALCCENYVIGHDNIELYLFDLNSTIILWNYTGFGLRKGLTTFGKIDKDVDILSKYIKNNFKDYKIIIHGCSIGGYSSIKIKQNFNDNDNVVLISDRTYGDIDYIALSFGYGKILPILYNILFPKFLYNSGNIDNFISISNQKKFICFDANDEIIMYNPASLIYNLNKKYYNDIIVPKINKYEEYKTLINDVQSLANELKELSGKNLETNGLTFIQHLNKDIDSIEEFFMFFIIFGYTFNKYKEIFCDVNRFNSYLQIPIIIRNFTNNYKDLFSNKLLNLIQILNFLFVKFNLKTEINDNDLIKMNYDENKDLFKFNDSFINEIHKYFGYVHRITCGHNGKLRSNDLKAIKEFLAFNKIIEK